MFRLVSTWDLPVAPDRAWQVIADVADWPTWWPGMSSTAVVRPGGRDAVGQRTAIVVRSPLAFRLRFGVEIIEASAPIFARARVVGDLVGSGTWEIGPTAHGSRATITWHVSPDREPLRSLARPLAGPLSWSHAHVMTGGHAGLMGRLGR